LVKVVLLIDDAGGVAVEAAVLLALTETGTTVNIVALKKV
jgi:hypothetical protein